MTHPQDRAARTAVEEWRSHGNSIFLDTDREHPPAASENVPERSQEGEESVESRIKASFKYDPSTGALARVSDRHAGLVSTFWPNGYVRVNFDGRSFLGHRVAWLLQTGEWPKDEVDHINLIKSDNRWCNLREAVRSQNLGNRTAYSNNKAGLKGAYFSKRLNKWQSFIQKDGEHKYLGLFETAEEAHLAYLSAANDNFGEFARGEPEPPTQRGSFMQTFTGRAVYPLDLRPEDIDIRDIAHSLAMQCRYAGHVRRFYSVAEHSVHVARHCRQYGPEAALEGLLHDATEAYLVDVPRPIKPFLKSYKLMEQRAAEAVADRFGLDPYGHPEAVHEADNRILNDERAALMSACERDWTLPDDRPLGVTIECWSPERAEREFLALFDELCGED